MRRDVADEWVGTSRFQIVRRIAGGSMGVVYEAYDRERKARIALKTLRSASPDTLQRFKNEFRWLQDLHHPNVVTFGELFHEQGRWFFTMELVDGVDFLSWVRPLPPGARRLDSGEWAADTLDPDDGRRLATVISQPILDEARLRGALLELARGLQALHRTHKVHRDVKPANILVTREGRVVLVDFGLARDARAARSGEHVVGTAEYMAPEQAASKTVGPAADWYAVGTVLYEALAGRPPFSGSPLEILINKQALPPMPPHARVPGVPADLDALCMDLLRANPAARPAGDEVLRRLGDAGAIEVAPANVGEVFVGRESELSVLRAALAEVESGHAVTVLVRGEAGVGKSALVRRFTDEVQARALVLAGRCYERESVPYKAVDGVIDAVSRHLMRLSRAEAEAVLPAHTLLLAQVFPVLRRVEAVSTLPLARAGESQSPQELRLRVFAAVRELFARLAAQRTLVIAIDDLQWSDSDSLHLLAEMVRRPEPPRILLVATVRGEALDPRGTELVQALGGPRAVRHVQVRRLGADDARQLSRALFGGTNPQIEAIADEAGGHPLFIDELVKHARHAEAGAPGKLRFDDAVWSRVLRLEPPVRQLLELVVVAGGPLPQEVFATAAAVDLGELGRRATQLRSAQLVRTSGARSGDTVEPYHNRVREAVLEQLDARTRKRWHERLALALEAGGARRIDPETLCIHWNGAGDAERAAHYACQAAAQATEALAFDRAARLYRLAIELRPVEAPAFQARLGEALAAAGRGADAARAYLLAADGASPRGAIDLRRRAAEQLLMSGHIDTGLDTLESVLSAMGMKLPVTPRQALRSHVWSRFRLRLRGLGHRRRDASHVPPAVLARIDACWSVGAGLGLVDTVRSFDFYTRHLRLALDAGEPTRVVRGLCAEAVYRASMGAYAAAERILERVAHEIKTIESAHAQGLHAMAGGIMAFLRGRWRMAATELSRAETVFRERCVGTAWETDTSEILHLLARLWLGELSAMSTLVPALSRDAAQRGDLYAATNLATALYVMRLAADDPDGARREAKAAIEKWSHRGFHAQHTYELFAQVNSALYAGDGADALARVTGAWPQIVLSYQLRTPALRAQFLDLRARAVAAAAREATGSEREAAAAQVSRAARQIGRLPTTYSEPLSATLLSLAAALSGERTRAAEGLLAAEHAFAAGDMAMHANAVRRQRGELIGGAAGKELCAQADDWFAREQVKNPVAFARVFFPLP